MYNIVFTNSYYTLTDRHVQPGNRMLVAAIAGECTKMQHMLTVCLRFICTADRWHHTSAGSHRITVACIIIIQRELSSAVISFQSKRLQLTTHNTDYI